MGVEGLRLSWAPVPADRAERRTVAWSLLRELLAGEGHPAAAIAQRCPHCGGAHGPVRIAGAPWRASVSYAGAVAVVGIHPDRTSAFGVDAEALIDPVRDAAGGIAGGLLRWVRTEAVLKADGRGFRGDSAVEIMDAENGWRADGGFEGWEPDGPPGVLVSVAVRSRADD